MSVVERLIRVLQPFNSVVNVYAYSKWVVYSWRRVVNASTRNQDFSKFSRIFLKT